MTQRCERPIEKETVEAEVERLGHMFDKYKAKYEELMSYPPLSRDAMYSTEVTVEANLGNWLGHLEKGGHVGKPGVTLMYDPSMIVGST